MATCAHCTKTGFEILPLRYGITEKGISYGVKYPHSAAVNGKPVKTPAIPEGANVEYSYRTLNAGYIYVFDGRKWYGYTVDKDGYLASFNININAKNQKTPKIPTRKARCSSGNHQFNSQIIRVPNTKTGQTIWVAYSPTPWSAKRLKSLSKVKKRNAIMRKVKVKQQHSYSKHVVSMANGVLSTWEYGSRKQHPITKQRSNPPRQYQNSLAYYETPHKKHEPCAVVLNDPVSLLEDVSYIMKVRQDHIIKDYDNSHALFTHNTLSHMQAMVESKARNNTPLAFARKHPSSRANYSRYTKKQEHQRIQSMLKLEKENVKKAWTSYAKKYNETKRKADMRTMQNGFNEKYTEHITPLETLWLEWVDSRLLELFMQDNYDALSKKNGIDYTHSVTRMYRHAVYFYSCREHALVKLNAATIETDNFILKACTLNNEEIEKKLESMESKKWEFIKQSQWVDLFKSGFEFTTQDKSLDAWLSVLASFATKHLLKIQKTKLGTLAFAYLTGRPVFLVSVGGSKKRLAESFVKLYKKSAELTQQSQKKVEYAHKITSLRIAEMVGNNPDKNQNIKFLVFDVSSARYNGKITAGGMYSGIQTPEEFADTQSKALTKISRNSFMNFSRASLGVMSAVLQFALLTSYTNAMAHEDKELKGRYYAGISGIVATSIGVVESLTQKIMDSSKYYKLFLKGLGITAGFVATLIMSYWDFKNAFDYLTEGKIIIASSYAISSALGAMIFISSTVLSFNNAILGGVKGILIMTALLIVTGIFIAIYKDSKIQKWIENCIWGIKPSYKTKTQSEAQLKLALK